MAGLPVSWYPRSPADHDTPRGAMTRDGVVALCGIRFEPPTTTGGTALAWPAP